MHIAPLTLCRLALAAAAGLAMTACTSDRPGGSLLGDTTRTLEPGDFVGDALPSGTPPRESGASPVADAASPARATPTVVLANDEPASRPRVSLGTDRPLPIDGMIGQINGLPVYADDVLADLADSLAAKGRQLPRAEFESQAKAEITEAVRSTLQSRLILAEAERALSENEWNGVRYMRDQRRAELLRMHGLGSLKAADRILAETTGRGLEETLDRFQDGLITQTYVNRNLLSRIDVSRRDIERFYRENLDRFRPAPVRDLTIIVVDSVDVAAEVERQLRAGTSYAEVAAGPMNQLAGDGSMTGLKGDHPFGRPEIEAPMQATPAGEWFGPVTVEDGRLWFVRVDRLEQGPQLSLEDAQASIEQALREQQRRLRTEQFVKRLSDEGNFTDPDVMIRTLTEIATSRYAGP